MIERNCARAWQAEAVLDGVLSQADRASFERHAATCAECGAERAALAHLEQVAKRTPSFTSTALRRRALHNELLRQANELTVGSPRRRPARMMPWFALAAGAIGLAPFFVVPWAKLPFWHGAEASFQLVASPGGSWHYAERGRTLRLALEVGTYTISVDKLEPGQRFLVNLPDGELEVRGTRFAVELAERRTRRVSVEEGRVALRLASRPEQLLGANQAWSDEAKPAAAEQPPVDPANGVAAGAGASARATANANAGAPALRSERAVSSDAASDFADAMAVFAQGDFGTAERLFHDFAERYPNSAHAEDALFLRALARSRRGDQTGARALAEEYLRRYPHGARASEARHVAERP